MSRSRRARSAVTVRPGSTAGWTARRRCGRSSVAATSPIACSSPTRPPPPRPATGRAPDACPTSTDAGGLRLSTQDDDVVDPRADLAVGTLGLALNGVDTHALPIVAEFEGADDLLGTGKFVVVMVQFRRPRRRSGVIDDQQRPTRAHRGCGALEQPRP